MKFKKLISLILSLSVVSSYAVNASAASSWTEPVESQVDAGQWGATYAAVSDGFSSYRYYGWDKNFANDYYQYISGSALSFSDSLDQGFWGSSSMSKLPEIALNPNNYGGTIGISGYTSRTTIDLYENEITTYFLPSLISSNDLRAIANINNASLSFKIRDSKRVGGTYTTATYTAILTQSGARGLYNGGKGEGVNLSLNIDASQQGVLSVELVGEKPKGTVSESAKIEYKIMWDQFSALLSAVGLSKKNLTLYAGDGRTVIKPLVTTGNDAVFTLNEASGWSICYKAYDETTEYITRTEANQMVKDLTDKIGVLDAQVNELQAEVGKLGKYTTEKEITKIIENYFSKEENLDDLIKVIFEKKEFDKLIENNLKEYFGYDFSDLGSYKNILIGYIISQVTTELKNLDTRLDKLETLISKAIESQLGNIFKPGTTLESLKDFILGLQLLGSLKGEDGKDGLNGKDGVDGIDGEDFAEWATRNYGGISNFINQISFEGWARSNYGSVDNFIRSISGTNGFSAYELAVQNGYYGSLGQWLESLQGKDGKSAYELAVENGYNGTERQWIDSLQGEDGADGEDGRDGRDGRDGNVVYVNGTYGELPGSDNASGTTQSPSSSDGASNNDVILTIDPPTSSGNKKGAAANPATGAAVGILLPAAAAASVLLVKKGGRRRGRK